MRQNYVDYLLGALPSIGWVFTGQIRKGSECGFGEKENWILMKIQTH